MAVEPPPPTATALSLVELATRLGDLPAYRIRTDPPPGLATEDDAVRVTETDRPCELIDGTLVEKAMGFYESRIGLILGMLIEAYAFEHNLGITAGGDGHMGLQPGLVRLPDVSFIRRERLPSGRTPRDAIARMAPDLAVEVLSRGNTKAEMDRKVGEYFAAGTRLVWLVEPHTPRAQAFRSPDDSTVIDEAGSLDGGDVLPGFSVTLRDLIARAG